MRRKKKSKTPDPGGQHPAPAAPPRRVRLRRIRRNDGEPSERGFFGFWRRYFFHLRRYLITGMLVWVPLIVTLWITWVAAVSIVGALEGFIRYVVAYGNEFGERIPSLRFLTLVQYTPGLGLLTAILIFLTTGLLARYLVTRRLIHYGELVLHRIPLINKVYRAVQQTRDVFVGRGAVFQEVVLVEYPRRGIWAVGFITAEGDGAVARVHGAPRTAVFVPTTPNPTSGFLLYFSPDEITPVDMSVEDAMKLIISGGALDPKVDILVGADPGAVDAP